MKTRIALVVILAALFAAPGAAAKPTWAQTTGQIAHRDDPAREWVRIAETYWLSKGWFTGECDADTVRVIWAEEARTIYGPVNLTESGYAAFTYQGGCLSSGRKMRTIWLNPYFPYEWWHWCSIVTHEYGHLIGLDHSVDPIRDPDGVMSGPHIIQSCVDQDPNLATYVATA